MLHFDIETNGLYWEVTTIHCLVIYDDIKDKIYTFDPTTSRSIEDGLRMLQEAETICGHNILGYDIPVIKKLYPWFKRPVVVDTRRVQTQIGWESVPTIRKTLPEKCPPKNKSPL